MPALIQAILVGVCWRCTDVLCSPSQAAITHVAFARVFFIILFSWVRSWVNRSLLPAVKNTGRACCVPVVDVLLAVVRTVSVGHVAANLHTTVVSAQPHYDLLDLAWYGSCVRKQRCRGPNVYARVSRFYLFIYLFCRVCDIVVHATFCVALRLLHLT